MARVLIYVQTRLAGRSGSGVPAAIVFSLRADTRCRKATVSAEHQLVGRLGQVGLASPRITAPTRSCPTAQCLL